MALQVIEKLLINIRPHFLSKPLIKPLVNFVEAVPGKTEGGEEDFYHTTQHKVDLDNEQSNHYF